MFNCCISVAAPHFDLPKNIQRERIIRVQLMCAPGVSKCLTIATMITGKRNAHRSHRISVCGGDIECHKPISCRFRLAKELLRIVRTPVNAATALADARSKAPMHCWDQL